MNKSPDVLTSRVRQFSVLFDVLGLRSPTSCGVASVRQDNVIRQCNLRDRLVTAESTSRLVVVNRGRPISRYTVRRRLREREITCRRPYVFQLMEPTDWRIRVYRRRHERYVDIIALSRTIRTEGGWSYDLGSDKLQV